MELTSELRQACDEIGQVKHIVSPNYEHTSFGKQVGHVGAHLCGFLVTALPAHCNIFMWSLTLWVKCSAVEGRLPQRNPLRLPRAAREGA